MNKNMIHLDDINLNVLIGNLNIKVYKLNRTFVAKEEYVPNHAHPYYEFHIVPKGKGIVQIEGIDFEVSKGQLYITGPNIKHMQISNITDPMMEYCLSCSINIVENLQDKYAFSYQEIKIIIETLSCVYPQTFKDVYNTNQKIEEIFREAEEKVSGYYLKIQTLIAEIIIDLFRTISPPDKIKYKYELPKKSEEEMFQQKLIEYVHVMYQKHFKLDDVAKEFSISIKQINKIFRVTINKSMHDYLLEYRFEMAKKLLLTTDLSIEEVAFEAGFSSHHYMYHVFKHYGEQTPAKLRA